MFYTSKIQHTLRLPPHLLSLPIDEAIKIELENIFLDKVIANLGLCISIYDIDEIEGGFIYPGQGASTHKVKFRLIVFRPFVGEIISAKLKESDANGLRLSLGFFYDIYVPSHLLPSPSHFEPDPYRRYDVRWIREFGDTKYIIDGLDEIKFRVLSVKYPPIPVEQAEGSKPFAPMVITGSIDYDGLGPVSWWCVLRGCVPKKLLVYSSKFSHEFDESNGFGWKYEAEPQHDWSTLIANKNAELQRLIGIYKSILNNAGVTLIEGRGKIVDPHTVDVDGKLYSARHILISVGGRPFIPDIPGSEYAIDSDAALDLPSKPEKIAIVGGGYIALEFAGIFNGLKSEVHVFIRQKKVLRGFDEEIRDFIAEQVSLRGIEFHTEETPQAILKSPDGSLSLKTNKGTVEGFSHVMFATGRRPNTKNLGLEAVGVKMNKNGAIEVDEYSRTSVPSIWAVGDVTDRLNLTPVALMEGGALAKTLFQDEPTKPDYRAVPSAVFSQPPIGQVGLSEEQAIQEYGDVDVFTANFRPLKATLSGLPDRVFMKLIVCAKTNKVLGLHMCGEDAPEIMQGFAVAVKAGLTKADFDATVGIHPTAAEEFVTMRTPTRKIRKSPPAEGMTDSEVKAAAGV